MNEGRRRDCGNAASVALRFARRQQRLEGRDGRGVGDAVHAGTEVPPERRDNVAGRGIEAASRGNLVAVFAEQLLEFREDGNG